ncbi:hypothetical protein SAMN05444008_1233 [Cnuella takakiae]|uniref:Uncharacterized protein n=1 Tax=Cnuella takakiae TaxID=1302690 RepID=A0A1M5IB93_9BACT|nr:hypothetical protein [Cnuella takakiae]OLY90775.1 hypothetical protein BUE76_01825 [Cnuella takakiae]SHG25339.1 hypothetical protein SAMN05444008_1233 [Cnuella takakiae]
MKQKPKHCQRTSDLRFLEAAIRNGGPIGVQEGQRFNFILRRYASEVRLMASELNPAYYQQVLKPYMEGPEPMRKWIMRTLLPIPRLLTFEEQVQVATHPGIDAAHLKLCMRQGDTYLQALVHLEDHMRWL